jgi:hypothetical protein
MFFMAPPSPKNRNGLPSLLFVLGLSLLVPLTTAFGDELLANGNFSQGQDGWGGDITDDTSITDPSISVGAPTSGDHITVNLQSSHAVRIYQKFSTASDRGNFSMTCTLYPGSKFTGAAKVSDIAEEIQESPVQNAVSGNYIIQSNNRNYRVYTTEFSSPVLILENEDRNTVSVYPLHVGVQAGAQTASAQVRIESRADEKLYIAFPPGEGSVAITHVSLTVPN